MADHHEFGKKGEELAAAWLAGRGFEILHRNWRQGRNEVDIIARLDDTLHFIEVKSRRGRHYGHPEESVSRTKLRNMMLAASGFLVLHPEWKRIQYDVLAIILPGKSASRDIETHKQEKLGQTEYLLIEDVYL